MQSRLKNGLHVDTPKAVEKELTSGCSIQCIFKEVKVK